MITEHNDKYFVMRSLAAEVNMLAKFLSMPGLTNDTNAADFFLVPWLCGTDQMLNDNAWGGGPLGTRLTRLLSFFTCIPRGTSATPPILMFDRSQRRAI
jgi:hypothetical protein